MGAISVTQGSSGTTYSTTLNFDEAGGPTGFVNTGDWAGLGLASISSADGVHQVNDYTASVGPWVGTGNSFFGNFGVTMVFDSDLTHFSAQAWDPSGPSSFSGGGFKGVALHDGVEVGSFFSSPGPAWGGLGDEWWDVTATDGMVFNEVQLFGFGFSPTTYVDNISWNAVPAPSGLALIGLGGFVASRRRR